MKLKNFNDKLYFFLALPALLIGCAQQQLAYQEPAPVYRPRQVQAEPAPKPKVETFKISDEPIISEALSGSEKLPAASPESAAAAENSAAPAVAVNSESAADAGYSAPQVAVNGSPAVLALMSDAESSGKSGDLEAAAAAIERALRIDSRNAALVYKLAQVRLEQNQPRLAEDLAKKSALLAENDRELKKNSWLLIAKARYMQGDKQGAGEARDKAGQF
jgi:tetratricopeptide (TPR) repeat protein